MKRLLIAVLAGLCAVSANANFINDEERFIYIDEPLDLLDFQYTFSGSTGLDGIMRTGRGIGGAIYGKYTKLTVQYQPSTYIDTIYVRAHDNVGQKQSADLELWINYRYHSKQNVPTSEGTIAYRIKKHDVEIVQLKSVRKDGHPSGEETMIKKYESTRGPIQAQDSSSVNSEQISLESSTGQ